MKGLVPLRVIAERMEVSMHCCKRRLKKYDARIGGGLLVQFGQGGRFFVDVAVLRRHLPGLASDDDLKDPLVALRESVDDIRDSLQDLHADTSAIRTAVGA